MGTVVNSLLGVRERPIKIVLKIGGHAAMANYNKDLLVFTSLRATLMNKCPKNCSAVFYPFFIFYTFWDSRAIFRSQNGESGIFEWAPCSIFLGYLVTVGVRTREIGKPYLSRFSQRDARWK